MGDERFKAWMGERLGVLQRIARSLATGADQHDLLQELMLSVWRAAQAFRGESAPATFIFRVAHNCALTWQRGEARRRSRHRAFEQLHVEADPAADPLLDRLYAAIRLLDSVDRSLLLLMLEGLSYADIGAIHGLSESNVGARLTRARKKLGQLTEEDDGL